MFTVQRLQLLPSLYKCLETTNIIENPQSGAQERTHNVTRCRSRSLGHRRRAWKRTQTQRLF